jgi:sucrose-phosphate synthase
VRRRKRLITIAVDCYESTQSHGAELVSVIKHIFEATRLLPAYRNAGYILSSSLKVSELLTILDCGKISAYEFDVLICSSGSELLYPGHPGSEDGGNSDPHLCVDEDYDTHIAYRWDRESVRKTISRWQKKYEQLSQALVEDDQPSNQYCLAYNVKDVEKVGEREREAYTHG